MAQDGIQTLDALVQEWLRLDKNEATRNEILELQKAGNTKELSARLGTRIEFGTAGLRARMEAGFSRMNDLTVIQASQGLAIYVERNVSNAKTRGIVIGHDHRHHSWDFARLTAAVFLSRGFRVWFFKDLVHTPLVPYTIKKLGAAAGVMITASHNPKDDNGYKVYWENACQIIPPHDDGIASSILTALEPWTWDYAMITTSDQCTDPAERGVIDDYINEVSTLCSMKTENAKSGIKFVYTAMHGVGTPFAQRAWVAFGFAPFISVREQIQPDPDFPTVAFPNPEEGKGSLQLAIQTANRHGAQIILANDPDADRLAVAEKLPSGDWKLFTGNEVGTILGAASLELARKAGKNVSKIAMVASTVSSKFLQHMAQVEGFHFEETLTGFKWIGNTAIRLEEQGYDVVFAFEEAIGFTVGSIVKDKDGVSALAFFSEWAAHLYAQNKTVNDYLQSLYEKYGYFVCDNSYFICHDKQLIQAVFHRIRYGQEARQEGKVAQLSYPETVGGQRVIGVRDLTVGYDSSTQDKKPTLPVSASSEMITFRLENGAVFTIRTSGTEPKIKYYSEICGTSEKEARDNLAAVVKSIGKELVNLPDSLEN